MNGWVFSSSHLPLRQNCLNCWENLNKRLYLLPKYMNVISVHRNLCFNQCWHCFRDLYVDNIYIYNNLGCEYLDNTCDGERWCWKIINGKLYHRRESSCCQYIPGICLFVSVFLAIQMLCILRDVLNTSYIVFH